MSPRDEALAICHLLHRQPRSTLAALAPRPGDVEAVFHQPDADRAARAYHRFHAARPQIRPGHAHDRVGVVCASAGELARPPRGFPREYAGVAGRLRPDVIWACWAYTGADRAALSMFDGLVKVNGRWCWLPRPWVFLPGDLPVSHWVE